MMKKIATAVFAALMIQMLGSCADLFKSKKTDTDRRGANSQLELGQRLYDSNCSGCHGKLESSAKKQASTQRITSAISSVPEMGHLQKLTKGDIEAISAALNMEAASKLAGAELYTTNCASCHGPLQKSQKLNKTTNDIKKALAEQPAMKGIRLSDDQIGKIATVLAVVGTVGETVGLPELRDRVMLASRLKRVFALSTDAEKNAVFAIIDREIVEHPEAFGGYCSRSEAGSVGDGGCTFGDGFAAYKSAASIANSTLVRSWRLDRACKSIAVQAGVAAFVANKVGGNIANPPNEEHLSKFSTLMSPGYTASTAAKISFAGLISAAQKNNYRADTQWQLMIYGVCGSLASEKL